MLLSHEAEGSLDLSRGVCLDGESGREGLSRVQERGIDERLVSVGVMVKGVGVGPIEDRLDEEEKGKQDEDEAAAVVAATEEEEDQITLAPMKKNSSTGLLQDGLAAVDVLFQ
ncbi:hypothetical protein NDA11_001519 [Ustilago hordei]|uniref:Uncharacterized protein n=1 Tax=Ustilago hordei TaxID=120017 RepID=I2FSJ3_USTHO|nr:uncharacterized protein UHO2_05716 [Ustilago hordei]KAJ1042105.1 hypothetical protein NDA10_008087 [Ustilago hordei]KAJ1573336.1 hypothetical protein NDA15_005108 [Ustilago hordei]KAJ1574769.1 hypothetical protein NDA12_003844 [Ustilago hordei]KAJ1576595.1 hypothetical protein NDA11_001519 [Ustilago hordei]CCF49886.1 uncharacterized protein UHOR_08258 [Ustilago hordei]